MRRDGRGGHSTGDHDRLCRCPELEKTDWDSDVWWWTGKERKAKKFRS